MWYEPKRKQWTAKVIAYSNLFFAPMKLMMLVGASWKADSRSVRHEIIVTKLGARQITLKL